ncbi:hypothetical protein D9M68_587540 [compost metagenome]
MRQGIDDGQACRDEDVDGSGRVGQFGELGQEDQDGQGVDEAGDDRAGNKAHQCAQFQESRSDLQDSRPDRCGEYVLDAMVLDQGGDQQGDCARRCGDHAGPATGDGGHDRDAECRVQADLRIDACNDGKGERFRDEGKSDDQAGEKVSSDIGQPFLAWGIRDHDSCMDACLK